MTKASEPTTTILAFLGSVALGFTAMINAVIAAVALLTGNLIGALGEASGQSASHAETVAKVVAIGFVVLAALEFGAGEFLRRRVRTILVPVASGATVVAELGLSVWGGHFTALAAILIGCALFATWTWWRLPQSPPVALGLELT